MFICIILIYNENENNTNNVKLNKIYFEILFEKKTSKLNSFMEEKFYLNQPYNS